MTNQHPIILPNKLVEEWYCNTPLDRGLTLATWAARWGADQELEACCQALYSRYVNTGLLPATAATVSQEMRDWLRTTRRPKPPSLKEQALEALEAEDDAMPLRSLARSERFDTIRRALEALND